MNAGVLIRTSNAATLPAVAVITCGGCGRVFGAGSVTAQTGRCGICGARLPEVPLPVAPAADALCDSCGIEHGRHFDGWDGSPLGCAETSRRWGGRLR